MIKKSLNKKSTPQGSTKDDLREKIQKKAYEIFTKRGYGHGSDLNDWLEAERIVKSQLR